MQFDFLILTAANEAQAEGYRAQLAWRRAQGLLRQVGHAMVVADPGGRRVGSLGATLHALAQLADELKAQGAVPQAANPFAGQRILICHSGGDSRRMPAYAAQGKVFTPMPLTDDTGHPLALFDLVLRNVLALPAMPGGQILVTAGDVLLTFDYPSVDFSQPGVTGVAYYGAVERGARHGVYVPTGFATNPLRTECLAVANFLQKPDVEQVAASKAMSALGYVAIDTGLLSIDAPTAQRLLQVARTPQHGTSLLAAIAAGELPAMDIYEELTMALAPLCAEPDYLHHFTARQCGNPLYRDFLCTFFHAVQDIAFQVNIVPYCEFFHVGSSRELLENLTGLSRTAQAYNFSNGSGAFVVSGGDDNSRTFICNAYIGGALRSGVALVEAVHLDEASNVELKGENILTGLPGGVTVPLCLPPGMGLVCLPVGAQAWAAIVYGLNDDFKTPFMIPPKPDATGYCSFLNQPLNEVLGRLARTPEEVWQDDQDQGLWQARLWRLGSLNEVLAQAMQIVQLTQLAPTTETYFSLAELLPRVNHGRLLQMRDEISRQVKLRQVTQRILANDELPASTICGEIASRAETRLVLQQLGDLLRTDLGLRPLLRARVLRLVAMIQAQNQWDALTAAELEILGVPLESQAAAFEAVAESVALSFVPQAQPRPAAILHDQVVWVTTPVRIDFAGGWSDTPPICSERGGAVLNAAVLLNGQYPIQVMAKLNNCGTIRLASIDLGERLEITTTAELLDHHDPHDWAALAKAAIVLAGVGPSTAAESLADWLQVMGGGLDLTIFSSLPKGSGMGTSSILGAAVLACLERVLGVSYSADRLIMLTSILEQKMSTGGGWQDQVGGVLPGMKLIRTQAGAEQKVTLRWASTEIFQTPELQHRCLLYFTGQKRMARNILQNVVNNYLAREPLTLATVERLKVVAEATKDALDAQDIEAFAAGVAEYWELKKQIDPGATNPDLEKLLENLRDDLLSALLPGAGGGGFIFMIAKSSAAAQRIRQQLLAAPPHKHARFFDFTVDRQGLKVTVL